MEYTNDRMTELNSYLTGLKQKKCKDYNECIENIISDKYNDTYFTYEHRIPVSEIKQMACKCIETKNYMMKAETCKGNCKENRPFLVLDLRASGIADMIDEIKCNVDFTLYIGVTVNTTGRVLFLCSVFHAAHALIYLDQPNMPSEIVFSKRLHYFSDPIRRTIVNRMNPDGIFDGDLVYIYGMAGLRSDFKSPKL